MAIDLQDNARYRLWKEFIGESKAVTIASVSLIACVLAVLIAGLSMFISAGANAKVNKELYDTRAELTATKNMMVLHNVYLQELYFLMKTEGLDPPPLPEE